jgi:DNA-binding NarL/FixJ family response regulator
VINVLIADDHKLVRQMLSQTINGEEDMSLAGEAENGRTAIELCCQLRPDVLVLDMGLPDLSGVQVIRELHERAPSVKVLVLTAVEDETYLFESLAAGAQGYLLKDSDVEEVLAAIRNLSQGKGHLHARSTMSLLMEFQRSRREPQPDIPVMKNIAAELTPREFEILELIGYGYSNPEIATRLFISEKTVKTHVSNILRRLNVKSRISAATFAVNNGLCRYNSNQTTS